MCLIHQVISCRYSRTIGMILSAILALALVPVTRAQETPGTVLERAKRATVFLMQTYDVGGAQVLSCVGSGSLISRSGLILTNAHLAGPGGPCRGERLVVSLAIRPDEPPVPTYVAEPVQFDEQFDLAVLQITRGLDGSILEPASLNLPCVEIGDASSLVPGGTLSLVGYPDMETTSISSSETTISGIIAEKSGSSLAWMRINTQWGGAASGGGAYDANGRLVGIPTSAPATDGRTPGPSCLSIQDNTRDGLITDDDICVPVGAPITQIRSVTYAVPLLEAASSGFRLAHKSGLPSALPTEPPALGRLFFSTGVSELVVPTEMVSAVPSGTTSLFLFFDYAAMRTGTPYELHVSLNGLEMPELGLGSLAWGGGTDGTWYIGVENILWPEGSYEFTLVLNGQPAATETITVGGAPVEARFSNLVFGVPGESGSLSATGILLPSEVTQVDAQFEFAGMTDGQPWTEIWYLDGSVVSNTTRNWDQGANGRGVVSALNYDGLPLGTYRLELLIGNRLAATGDIHLAGRAGPNSAPTILAHARGSSAMSPDEQPDGQVGSVMPLGVTRLYMFVDWDLMPLGTLWTYRWFLDGRLVASSTQRWDGGGVGTDYWISLSSSGPLPEGTYAVEVIVENRPMFSSEMSIGSGTRPLSGAESAADDVVISGVARDAVTGEGVPDATVMVLDWTLESARFSWDESEVHTQAITDQRGRFALPRGLPRGHYYTVYVFAESYITIVEDNFTILSTQPSPVD